MWNRIVELRNSMLYAVLVAWRTRSFWLRTLTCFLLGAILLFFDQSDNYDLRFKVRGTQAPDPQVIVIDIPDRDWVALEGNSGRNMIRPLKELTNYSDSLFWNRKIWENLLSTILEHEPTSVGIAFYFGDTVRRENLSPRQQALFVDPRLVWGADLDSNGRPLIPDFATTYGAQAALKHIRADDDGIVRRFTSSYLQIPAMPILLAEGARQRDSKSDKKLPPMTLQLPALINFRGPAGTFVTLNVRDVIERRVPLDVLRGKIVIIGSSSRPIDQMQTPLGRIGRAEVIANFTDNILAGRAIRRAPDAVYFIGLILLMVFAVWVLTTYPQTVALIVFLWTGTLLAALSVWTFDSFYFWTPILAPLAMLAATHIIFLSYQLSMNEQKAWRLEQERRYLLEVEQLKNNFVSMMSHDLKTPIAKIQGITDRLLMAPTNATPFSLSEDLKSLRRSSDDLHRYIKSILQVTRVEARDFKITKEVIDINDRIIFVTGRLMPLALEKQVKLTSNLEPMFSIEADPTLIEEVILNLVENAIKYTPSGGTVQVTSREQDDNVFVIVEDTGVGIAAEDQEAVWGKFTRGKNLNSEVKGTGLGLYLVKYFVELHGGRVFLESIADKGTKIGFSIPVATESDQQSSPHDLEGATG